MTLSVFSQNCYWLPVRNPLRRFRAIRGKIKAEQPDIVLLQEVVFRFQAQMLKLEGYDVFFESSRNRLMIRGGLVTLVKKKHKAKQAGFEKFKKQGKIFSSQWSDRLLGKGFLKVRIQNTLLLNTHLVNSYYDAFVIDHAQEHQLQQMLASIVHHDRVILGGDLNFDEGSLFYAKTTVHLKDWTYGLGHSETGSMRKIDFVLTKGLDVQNHIVQYLPYPAMVSDHRAIKVNFEVGDKVTKGQS